MKINNENESSNNNNKLDSLSTAPILSLQNKQVNNRIDELNQIQGLENCNSKYLYIPYKY